MNRSLERLSYLDAPDVDYTLDLTFDPCKNLNDVFREVEAENLKVYLRVRPNLPGESQEDEETRVEIVDSHTVLLTAPASSNTFRNSSHGAAKLTQKFSFSHIYGPDTTQKELFDTSALVLVQDFIKGQNCLLFTYGATNSGKTFTVQGTPLDAGLLPRTLDLLFTSVGGRQYPSNDLKPKFFLNVVKLDKKDALKEEERKEAIFKMGSELSSASQSAMSLSKSTTSDDSLNITQALTDAVSHNSTSESRVVLETDAADANSPGGGDEGGGLVYAVYVSYAEIYNEYIFDLLERMPASRTSKWNPLVLGEDRNGAIYVKGLQEVRVNSAQEALRLLEIGRQNLHFAATRLNHHSSRSHCIFTVKLIRLASADSPHVARVSMLSVCDLAGAERACKSRSSHDRLKEAGNINTSLLVLSRCIDALRRNQSQKGVKKREIPVPYRDSKLTRLFQSFFLGRGKIAMIVNISRMPLLYDETIQVLKFSAIAKQVMLSQVRVADTAVEAKPVKPVSQFSRFMRRQSQALKSSGRLSAPWDKRTSDVVTFGANDSKIAEEEEQMSALKEEEEPKDEEFDALLQLIARLKDELVKEHKEKVGLEVRLREELCAEFSQQIVEIENSWSQRLRDQQTRSEELTEWKIQALMEATRKLDGRKRQRGDNGDDDEYVSSIYLFQEQRKVQELEKQLEEVEADRKHLKEEVEALMEAQRKTRERENKAKEEVSRLTFQLAQLTLNYDKLTKELEEAKQVQKCSSGTESLVIQGLKTRLEEKRVALEEQDKKCKEFQAMLCEAADMYMAKEEECADWEKNLRLTEHSLTQQMLIVNERESQLEEIRSMLSQRAADVEERDQYIEDLRERLAAAEKSTDMENTRVRMERKMREREEEYLREKSKLLLQIAELKRNGERQGDGEMRERIRQLVEEKNQLREEKDQLVEEKNQLKEEKNQLEEEKDQLVEEKEQLKEEKEQLREEKDQLKEEKNQLREEKNQLKEEKDQLVEEKDQLKEENVKLSNKMVGHQQNHIPDQFDHSEPRAEMVSAKNRLNHLQNVLGETDELITTLESQVAQREMVADGSPAESADPSSPGRLGVQKTDQGATEVGLEGKVEELEEKVNLEMKVEELEGKLRDREEAIEKCARLEDELARQTEVRQELEVKLEALEGQAKKREHEKMVEKYLSLEDDLKKGKEVCQELEGRVKELEGRVREFEGKEMDLEEEKEKCVRLEGELEGLRTENESLKVDFEERESSWRTTLEKNVTLEDRCIQNQEIIEILKEEVSKATIRVRESESEVEREREEMQGKVSELVKALKSSSDLCKGLELDKDSLRDKEEEIKALKDDLERLKDEVEELQVKEEENKTLKADLERLKGEVEDLEGLKVKEEENNTLKADLERLKGEVEELEGLRVKEEENKTLKGEMERLKGEVEGLREKEEENKTLKADLDRLKGEVEELHGLRVKEEENKTLKADLERLKGEVEELHGLRVKEEENKTLKADLERLKGEVEELEGLRVKVEENKTLKADLERLKGEAEQLKGEVEAETLLRKDDNSRCCGLKEQLEQRNKELHTLKDEYEHLRIKLAERMTSRERGEAEASRTSKRLSNVEGHAGRLLGERPDLENQPSNFQDSNLKEILRENAELKRRLDQHQFQTELVRPEKEIEEWQAINTALQEKLIAVNATSVKQKDTIAEKEGVIAALQAKIKSLDGKLSRAEDEVEKKRQALRTFETRVLEYHSVKDKCNILEKENLALREARQEQQEQQHSMVEQQEEQLRTKETQISSLEQEVKRLMQHSLMSCNTSAMSDAHTTSKTDAHDTTDSDIHTLREEIRRKATLNDSLMQEVLSLKSQIEKFSLSSQSAEEAMTTKTTTQKDAADVNKSIVSTQPTPKGRAQRGRKQNTTPAATPSDTSHLALDSSIERSGVGRKQRQQTRTSTISFSTSASALSPSPAAPQRSSRRTRRPTRNSSFEYDVKYRFLVAEAEGDEEEWQPSRSLRKPPKSTGKSARKSKAVAPPSPYLREQENKSSVANRAEDHLGSLERQVVEVEGKKVTQKKKRQLYKSDASEPYQITPDKLLIPEVVDSPHTIVRRQLRSRRK